MRIVAMVRTTPGWLARGQVDTRGADRSAEAQAKDVLVELAYLKSYENMGSAEVTCVSGVLVQLSCDTPCDSSLCDCHWAC